MTDKEMRLEAGSVVALRFYDLGRTVDVDKLATAVGGEVERPQFPTGAAGGLRYTQRPVELSLDDVEVPLEDGRVFADASVRVFDFGVAAVALRVLVGGLEWDRFTERVEAISNATDGRTRAWDEVEQRLRTRLQKAGVAPNGDAVARHVFVIARRFGSALPLDELVDGDYAASLVSRDWLPLTSMARAELLRGSRAAGSDLIVAGDQRTFIVESKSGSGLPDAVEAALAQRAALDAVGGAADGARAASGLRTGRAAALVASERGSRLAGMYAVARDRFGLGDAELVASRHASAGGARGSLVPYVVVAIVTAIVTALIVLAFA
ncbi:MAG TPA: hypothetical protein VF215_17780 [Thermoanaerobaculia bacterium]